MRGEGVGSKGWQSMAMGKRWVGKRREHESGNASQMLCCCCCGC